MKKSPGAIFRERSEFARARIRDDTRKKLILSLVLMMALITALMTSAISAFAAEESNGMLKPVEVSLRDKVSLQNGAKLFVNYCMSCHSAKFMRYNRMAADLEIPEQLVESNMIFTGGKIGDAMTTTLSKEAGEQWFGVAPPDLSLIGKLRDPEWLYGYLRSFYIDDSTETGWNNLVFPNVAMPHVLYELQGIQKAIFNSRTDQNGNSREVFDSFELVSVGKMDADEYDHAMRDLTNFLYYMGEPARMVRIKYGIWTMLFLVVLGSLAFMLKKEYWRDID
ncbi:cytochrome c1 [Candidatus Spongiihabitans sp.]|uniref:cytochrome c1 n=1 Tax=Candidatus Spongiihabitans sp. TaxID=3101308 RepID=UPI003C705846